MPAVGKRMRPPSPPTVLQGSAPPAANNAGAVSALGEAALLRAAAWHEAGHAVMAWRFGKPFDGPGVMIRLDRPGMGKTFTPGTLVLPLARLPEALRPAAERRLRAECIEYLAGYLAEERALGRRGRGGGGVRRVRGEDAHRAVMLVMRARGCIQVVAELHLAVYARATQRLLCRPDVWAAVDLLAGRLMEQGRVGPADLQVLLAGSGLRPVGPRYFAVAWRASTS